MASESRRRERDLEILRAIEAGDDLTQRDLASRLGVALGLANLYLKRLVTKGHVKVTQFHQKPLRQKRARYLLTPKGLAEKTRLTYEYMGRSLALYRVARETLRAALEHLPERGLTRVAIYGTGEAAELAWLTLKERGLEPIAVFSEAPGGTFLGMAVHDLRELPGADVDAVIVATFDKPKVHVPRLLALGMPAAKLITLRPYGSSNGAR